MDMSYESKNLQILYESIKYKDWKKIGEVYSSRQSQCFFICSICSAYANVDSAYVVNDISTYWNHIQQEHMNRNTKECSSKLKYKDRESDDDHNKRSKRKKGTTADSTDSNNLESINIPSVVRTPQDDVENKLKAANENLQDTLFKYEKEFEINDVNVSDNESHDSYTYNQTVKISDVRILDTVLPDNNRNFHALDYYDDDKTVQISDDEDIMEKFTGLRQCGMADMDTIELSDDDKDEDDVTCIESNTLRSTAQKDSLFTYKPDIYNCEKSCEMDSNDMTENKKCYQIPETSLIKEKDQRNISATAEVSPNNHSVSDNVFIPNYRCKHCPNTFCSVLQLEEHQRSHVSIGEVQRKENSRNCFTCLICGNQFCSETRLKSHQKLVHSDAKKCVVCQNMVLDSDLVQHMSREHSLSDHPLLTRMLLSEMVNTKDAPMSSHGKPCGLRPFKCVLCGKRTGSMKSMIIHHHRFHSEKSDSTTTRCGICQKCILTKNMRSHVSSVHGRLGKYSCKTCYISFKSKSSFKDHMTNFHIEEILPSSEIQDDIPSSSSASSQVELTPEEREYLFQLFTKQSQEIMDESSNNDNSDDDVITFGEVIPPINIIAPNS